MKKLIAALLALLLLAALTACTITPITPTPSRTEAADTKAPASQTDAPKTEPASDTEPTPKTPDFEEVTVIDNELCTVTITDLTEDSLFGWALKARMENKTEDQNLLFVSDTASINGVNCDAGLYTKVEPGKKVNDKIVFSAEELMAELEAFTDIELTVLVCDAETWSTLSTEHFQVYPYGEAAATRFVREAKPTDLVLADNDQISVTVTGYDPDSILGYSVKVYVENKTDATLVFTTDSATVNGVECMPYWTESVEPGKSCFCSIDWMKTDFEENGIEAVEEIELVLRVFDAEDYWADDIYNETVTLNP